MGYIYSTNSHDTLLCVIKYKMMILCQMFAVLRIVKNEMQHLVLGRTETHGSQEPETLVPNLYVTQ